MKKLPPIEVLFTELREVTSGGCWEWQGTIASHGYGVYNRAYVHRLSWEFYNQDTIPAGMHIDHLCRNTKCFNPEHLEVVTPGENFRRSNNRNAILWRAGRCIRGHRFTPGNTYRRSDGAGRVCKACCHIRYLNRKARRKREAAS
jgi:hypothetical protein